MGTRATWIAIATCLSCLGATERAGAFGVLGNQPAATEVRSHRVALAVSPDRTVLWDELTFSGAPTEFLWLFPVKGSTTFEIANPAWFDTLEAVTRPRVGPLHPECVSVDSGGGCSCAGAQPEPLDSSTTYTPSSVQVLRTNTVGPYRMNLLRSNEPGALAAYVAEGGYVIPPGFESTLESYLAEGYDFLAASVRPTAGVADMKPIRVVTQGGTPVLPLRMLAAGAAPLVNVDLFVIAEGRQSLPELTEVFLERGALTWDAALAASNFELLESNALARYDGFGFFTAFASGDPFAMQHLDVDGSNVGFSLTGGVGAFTSLSELYFAQGRLEAATAAPPCPSIVAALRSDLPVSDSDTVEQDHLDDLLFACGPMVDIQQALIGMRPARVWLTRLDLELRPELLSQDYLLSPHSTDAPVTPVHVPARLRNAPAHCHEPIFQSSLAPRRVRPFGWGMVPLVLVAAVLRRRSRARSPA
jgi:hypothetical protein